ncbi:hypothetical protein NDU88_007518 [Pleurodeles waltl]|uniref:Uncharacterized protein n=1 Tax=Pleurodeles waltl TaxID=8319 RepID=A0AAV7LXY4_PLEWA|nr:hypothetical protein NDU88_007518 [Pleurodeles waltl]
MGSRPPGLGDPRGSACPPWAQEVRAGCLLPWRTGDPDERPGVLVRHRPKGTRRGRSREWSPTTLTPQVGFLRGPCTAVITPAAFGFPGCPSAGETTLLPRYEAWVGRLAVAQRSWSARAPTFPVPRVCQEQITQAAGVIRPPGVAQTGTL